MSDLDIAVERLRDALRRNADNKESVKEAWRRMSLVSTQSKIVLRRKNQTARR